MRPGGRKAARRAGESLRDQRGRDETSAAGLQLPSLSIDSALRCAVRKHARQRGSVWAVLVGKVYLPLTWLIPLCFFPAPLGHLSCRASQIDEPKTPYEFAPPPAEDDGTCGAAGGGLGGAGAQGGVEESAEAVARRLEAAGAALKRLADAQRCQGGAEGGVGGLSAGGASCDDSGGVVLRPTAAGRDELGPEALSTPSDDPHEGRDLDVDDRDEAVMARKEAFRAKRRAHYNEFMLAKQALAAQPAEEDNDNKRGVCGGGSGSLSSGGGGSGYSSAGNTQSVDGEDEEAFEDPLATELAAAERAEGCAELNEELRLR